MASYGLKSETTDMIASLFPHLRPPIACVFLQLIAAAPLLAEPAPDFNRGRTLTLVSGFTPNGENDAYLRQLGRHIDRVSARPLLRLGRLETPSLDTILIAMLPISSSIAAHGIHLERPRR
jgi:hypothetical protein